MQKAFIIYPEDELTLVDYCYQFNEPFVDECANFIDAKLKNGDQLAIDIVIKNDKGIGVGSATVTPTRDKYLGELDGEFDNILLKLRYLGTLTVSVNIRVIDLKPSPKEWNKKIAAVKKTVDLVHILLQIEEEDKTYDERDGHVYHALGLAKQLGYPAGIRIDPRDINWPIITIVLPDVGEVSWHCSAYKQPSTGFDVVEQHRRLQLFVNKHI